MGIAICCGCLVGLVMGAFGAGGGVLAVPLLAYALGLSAQLAGTISLAAVAAGAGFGLATLPRPGRVHWRLGGLFGVLGALSSAGGAWLASGIPNRYLLLAFAPLLLTVAVLTWRRAGGASSYRTEVPTNYLLVVPTALGVGLLTGFFGVGGGFAVVPALVLLLGLAPARAAATSLVVLAINACAALAVRVTVVGVPEVPWQLAAAFVLCTIMGTVVGTRVAGRVSGSAFLRGFAVLLAAVGVGVGIQVLWG